MTFQAPEMTNISKSVCGCSLSRMHRILGSASPCRPARRGACPPGQLAGQGTTITLSGLKRSGPVIHQTSILLRGSGPSWRRTAPHQAPTRCCRTTSFAAVSSDGSRSIIDSPVERRSVGCEDAVTSSRRVTSKPSIVEVCTVLLCCFHLYPS